MKIYFAGITVFFIGFFLFMLGAPFKEWETKLIYEPTRCTAVQILPLQIQWRYGPPGLERWGVSDQKMALVNQTIPCFYLPNGRDQDFVFEFEYSVVQWVIALECMFMSVLVMAVYPLWRKCQMFHARSKVRIYQTVMMQ